MYYLKINVDICYFDFFFKKALLFQKHFFTIWVIYTDLIVFKYVEKGDVV